MAETLIIRCSLKSPRVAYLVAFVGLVAVGLVVAFVLGGFAERGIGQILLVCSCWCC